MSVFSTTESHLFHIFSTIDIFAQEPGLHTRREMWCKDSRDEYQSRLPPIIIHMPYSQGQQQDWLAILLPLGDSPSRTPVPFIGIYVQSYTQPCNQATVWSYGPSAPTRALAAPPSKFRLLSNSSAFNQQCQSCAKPNRMPTLRAAE